MKKNDKVGLITYHSAYNFGSALQAYGTVKTISELGYDVDTIDYRTHSQEYRYKKDLSLKRGLKGFLCNLGFNFIKKQRKIRAEKFENFMQDFLHLTPRKYSSYKEFTGDELNYPILISGSDQIWNPGCDEFQFEPEDAMMPYFLQFGKDPKRISYASSPGDLSLRQMRAYRDYLRNYDILSMREPGALEYAEKVSDREIELVCDPTWLLDKDEWLSLEGIPEAPSKPYIFVYILYWSYPTIKMWMQNIKKLAKQKGLDIYCISPVSYYSDKEINMVQDAGPLDFLSLIAHADLVITSTFHGTIFSMNFEVPFFSCYAQSRQMQMLHKCDLEDRMINSPGQIFDDDAFDMDFTHSREIIREFRETSKNFLKNALNS